MGERGRGDLEELVLERVAVVHHGENVVVTGSNPLVNQAVEKFRLWLIEKFKFYCSSLIDLLDAEAGVVQVITYSPFNSSLLPSVSFCHSARRAATPRRKRSPSST